MDTRLHVHREPRRHCFLSRATLGGELTQMVADEDASGEAPAGSEFQQLRWELPVGCENWPSLPFFQAVGFRLGEVPLT